MSDSAFIKLEIDKATIEKVVGELNKIKEKQLPFAMQVALNKSTIDCWNFIKEQMENVFDRPTPYTINSLRMKFATKQKLEGKIFFKDRSDTSKGNTAGNYLKPDVFGTDRPPKRSEEMLRNHGILTQNEFLVPSNALPIDMYGNVQRSEMGRILSALQSTFDSHQYSRIARRVGKSSNQYFVTESSTKRTVKKRTGESVSIRRTRAIWKRTVYGARPLFFIISRAPHYPARFKFEEMVASRFNLIINKQFTEAFRYAMETARTD